MPAKRPEEGGGGSLIRAYPPPVPKNQPQLSDAGIRLVVKENILRSKTGILRTRKSLTNLLDYISAPRRRLPCKVIFVHGCFWHQHPGCGEGRPPSSNEGYWKPKLARNVERDASALAALTGAGWEVLVMWECETKDRASLQKRLCDFLS
jgi:DNA mismatch endonuclease Vsr